MYSSFTSGDIFLRDFLKISKNTEFMEDYNFLSNQILIFLQAKNKFVLNLLTLGELKTLKMSN